jgi:hypothetical protein
VVSQNHSFRQPQPSDRSNNFNGFIPKIAYQQDKICAKVFEVQFILGIPQIMDITNHRNLDVGFNLGMAGGLLALFANAHACSINNCYLSNQQAVESILTVFGEFFGGVPVAAAQTSGHASVFSM